MKKINSLTSIARIAERTASPARSPLRASFPRSQSTSIVTQSQSTTVTVGTPQTVQEAQSDSINVHASVTSRDPIPRHDDSHAGPYGVETPLEWEFHVAITKVLADKKEDYGGEAESSHGADVKEGR